MPSNILRYANSEFVAFHGIYSWVDTCNVEEPSSRCPTFWMKPHPAVRSNCFASRWIRKAARQVTELDHSQAAILVTKTILRENPIRSVIRRARAGALKSFRLIPKKIDAGAARRAPRSVHSLTQNPLALRRAFLNVAIEWLAVVKMKRAR